MYMLKKYVVQCHSKGRGITTSSEKVLYKVRYKRIKILLGIRLILIVTA